MPLVRPRRYRRAIELLDGVGHVQWATVTRNNLAGVLGLQERREESLALYARCQADAVRMGWLHQAAAAEIHARWPPQVVSENGILAQAEAELWRRRGDRARGLAVLEAVPDGRQVTRPGCHLLRAVALVEARGLFGDAGRSDADQGSRGTTNSASSS